MPFFTSAAQTRGSRLPATVTPAAVSRNSRRVTAGLGSECLGSVMEVSSGGLPPLSHRRTWKRHEQRRGRCSHPPNRAKPDKCFARDKNRGASLRRADEGVRPYVVR